MEYQLVKVEQMQMHYLDGSILAYSELMTNFCKIEKSDQEWGASCAKISAIV